MNRAGTEDRMMRECDSPSVNRTWRKSSLDKRQVLVHLEEPPAEEMILGGIQTNEFDLLSKLEPIEQSAIGYRILRVAQTLEVRAHIEIVVELVAIVHFLGLAFVVITECGKGRNAVDDVAIRLIEGVEPIFVLVAAVAHDNQEFAMSVDVVAGR